MSVEILGQLPSGTPGQPQLNLDRYLIQQDAFARAVEQGKCFIVCNQIGVTSQAGLSGTTPVLSLVNPAGSGVTGKLWMASAFHEVACAAAAATWLCAGTNTVAAAVTGTLTTAHRNLKLGSAGVVAGAQGNRIVPMLAATLPAAPVAIDLLGVALTGAITTIPALLPMTKWYLTPILFQPGTNLSIQTSTASGTAGLSCSYIWQECDLIN